MPGVRIVTDSASDLPADLEALHRVGVVPLTIRFGDEDFVDREELSAEAFYEKMASTGILPQTAAPSPGAFEQAFTKMADEGADAVVCITLSSKLSATMSSAQNAAAALAGKLDVRVVDSRSITSGLATQVIEAATAASEGRSADDIVALVEDLSTRTKVYGALDSLENLKKGGRIGGAQAMLGTMLSIKPCIDISTGEVEEAGKQRTRRKSLLWLRDTLFAVDPAKVRNLCASSGGAPDLDELVALVSERFDPDTITRMTIGAVIGTHGGPRVIGLTWQQDD